MNRIKEHGLLLWISCSCYKELRSLLTGPNQDVEHFSTAAQPRFQRIVFLHILSHTSYRMSLLFCRRPQHLLGSNAILACDCCQWGAMSTCMCFQPLDQVYTRRRVYWWADFSFLQRKGRIFKFLLHVTTSEEAPTTVSQPAYSHPRKHVQIAALSCAAAVRFRGSKLR